MRDLGPVRIDEAVGKTGLVLGTGWSLDYLPNGFLDAVKQRTEWISVGLNRIMLSQRLKVSSYIPDIVLVWDAPRRDNPHFNEWCLFSLRDTTNPARPWRVLNDRWPNKDEPVPEWVNSQSTCADAAVDMLYKMGVRTIYLAGVDYFGNHCQFYGEFLSPPNPWQNTADGAAAAACWPSGIMWPGLQLVSLNPVSLLVAKGRAKFGLPEWCKSLEYVS